MQRVLPFLAVVCLFFFTNCLLAQNTPIIFCPGNINDNLGSGECETTVNFQISAIASGNQPPPLIYQSDGTGYTSGDVFPIGMTTLQFVAVDTASPYPFPADTCTFIINVVEYNPASPVIVTDDDLSISIPPVCEMFLLPAMVLEGSYGCYDDFVINVENTGSNYIGYYYVGETISYTITNTETGMMGWGDVTIEDKNGPFIQGCDSAFVSCLADVRPVSEGGEIPNPIVTDCNSFDSLYVDMLTHGTCQDTFTSIVMRIWTAVDELGHVSSCNQIIVVDRTSLTDISPICPADTSIECSIGVVPDFSPMVTGYPTADIDGQIYDIADGGNSICNISSSYSDMPISGCGVTYKIIRTWTVMDWCLPLDFVTNPWRCTQIIEYIDTTPPDVTAPMNMTVNANLPGCRARPIIPAVNPTDCSGFSVFISTPVGPIAGNGGQIPAPGLSLGNHLIQIKVTDNCGNATNVSFTITVEDQSQPTPVCDAHTVVALDNLGYAFAYATTFDDGSTDNCCVDNFEVARVTDNCNLPDNLLFRDYIEFCCADIGQVVNAIMRVWDCNGNSNICNVEIEVQDINGPSITCPPNVTLLCGDSYTDPNVVGEVVSDPAFQGAVDGLASDNCNDAITIVSSDAGQISCGSGIINRTYSVSDQAGASNFCVQTITVQNNNPFTGNNIVFPSDTTINFCGALVNPSITGIPTYPMPNGCHSLVHGQDPDFELATIDGSCRKIQRRWYVIDWCQYNPNNPNTPGLWTYAQIITVMDQEGPIFQNCSNLAFCNFKDDCSDLAPNLAVSAMDACTDNNLLTYSWTVDLYNDGQADPAGYSVAGIGQNTTNEYPNGTHQISYTSYDGCGNTGSCSFLFTINDCKNPTAFCRPGIIVELMQTGMIPVNVMQLEEGSSSDNCSARADLQFSFSANTANTDLIFDCNNIGQNAVDVWVTDEAGNQDFCSTFVVVQDNMNACGSPLISMSGAIANESNDAIEKVMVEMNGDMNSMAYTNNNGVFQFDNVPTGQDYTLTPQLDTDPLNGVTTYDLYLLQRHILGIELLDTPYKLIAADANKSGAVTTFDVVEIRKVILYINLTFPNNTSWRFVDKEYSFPNPANPFEETFPEVYNINNFSGNNQTPNFVAVKTGDLNNTAVGSLSAVEDRTGGGGLVFSTVERMVKTGETFTIDITADLANVMAFQFTFGFDMEKLEVVGVTPGVDMTEANFGLANLEEGFITTSWFRVLEVGAEKGAPLFSVSFTANESGLLSDMVNLHSRLTKAEAYEKDGAVRPASLAFQGSNGTVLPTKGFELFQNVPNPFNNATIIGFQLPEAANASLMVYDVSGKLVKETNGHYSKGYHEISLEHAALPGKGIFYYRLETPTHTATKKMTML